MSSNFRYLILTIVVIGLYSSFIAFEPPRVPQDSSEVTKANPGDLLTAKNRNLIDVQHLKINELTLGMTREEVYKTRSLIDGRFLKSTHHSRNGLPIEMVGHAANGIDACSWVQFSGEDQLVGLEGVNLFLDGRRIEPRPDGTIPELGKPTNHSTNSEGLQEFEYANYSLTYSIDREGRTEFTLGHLDFYRPTIKSLQRTQKPTGF